MENYNNEIFGFGNDTNEELEQTNNFSYDSISGLGQSDYENDDLFNTEVETNETLNNDYVNDFRIGGFENTNTGYELADNLISNVEEFKINEPEILDDNAAVEEFEGMTDEGEKLFEALSNTQSGIQDDEEEVVSPVELTGEKFEEQPAEMITETAPVIEIEDNNTEEEQSEVPVVEEQPILPEENEEITFTETPIEELNKLTHFEEEKIEETDINDLFDRVSVNVKDASDIFRKNTDLKQKIDTRFEELKKLQSEIENSRKKQIDEINSYKEDVLNKLTEKKEEIEKRLNLLKETQANLEKEKQEFETYKKKEQENIDRVQKEVQSAYDDRREELNHIEDVLRKQKDSLDEERSQLSLDRIQYESDKNELANNLLKFNEIVNSFTNGMNDIKE